MFYVYLVIAAAAVPILDKHLPVLRMSYSLWLVPLLFIAVFLGLVLIHAAVFVLSILAVNLKGEVKHKAYYHKLFDLTAPLVFRLLRITVKSEGEEKLPENRRFVLVCNHTDNLDPAVIMTAFSGSELSFLGKAEIKKEMPFVAKFMHATGSVFLDRQDKISSAKATVNAIKMLKNGDGNVGIFPEGHRSPDGKLQPFKEGAFKIAQKAKVPIVVCAVKGVKGLFKGAFIKRKTAFIKVLKVIEPTDYENQTPKQLSDTVFSEIQNELN